MAEGRELMAERHSKSEYRTSDQDKEWFRSESFWGLAPAPVLKMSFQVLNRSNFYKPAYQEGQFQVMESNVSACL